jgi:hypothetical protein
MPDLSQVQNRQTMESRPTDRRAGIFPLQRDTDAPAFSPSGSMRNADRGDAGAAQLRQIFGIAEQAAQDFQQYTDQKFQKDKTAAADQGSLDQARGQIDAEQMAHSHAYAKAVNLGNAQRQTYDMLNGLHDSVTNLLTQDPNATIDGVNAHVSKTFSDFGVLDGKPRDFGSPEANLKVAQMLQEARVNILDNSRAAIKKQVDQKSLDTAASNLTDDLARGKPLDIETAMTQVPPGVDRKQAKTTLITAAVNQARSLQDKDPTAALGIVDQLLWSARADGTPSISADERESLLSERRSMANQIKTATDEANRKKWDANSDGVMNRIMGVPGSGAYPSMAEIAQGIQKGELDSEHGHMLMNMIHTDHERAKADAREERSEHRAEAAEARQAAQDAADAVGTETLSGLFSGQMTVSQATTRLLSDAAAGRYGDGAVRQRAVSKVMSQIGAVRSARGDILKGSDFRQGMNDLNTAYNAFQSDMDTRALPQATRTKGKVWLSRKLKEAQTLYGSATVDQGDPLQTGENIIHSWTKEYVAIFGTTRKIAKARPH